MLKEIHKFHLTFHLKLCQDQVSLQ